MSENSVAENIREIKNTLPDGVSLIAVSKFHTVDTIMEAYSSGQRIFGENRVQELVSKYEALPKDIEWHMIGHLQKNKVKYIIQFVSMIQSVDSLDLLQLINSLAERCGRKVNCLLQFHVAAEETKSGFLPEDAAAVAGVAKLLPFVSICGVMGMATNTDEEERVRGDFRRIRTIFDELKAGIFAGSDSFNIVSMGMSGDYRIAAEEGSTMVRVGTSIFGARE